jgi:hypothetical protein
MSAQAETRQTDIDRKPLAPGTITERDIVESYADLLNELRLLTTVSVLLFGFLLTVARSSLGAAEEWLLLGAMISAGSATIQFVLPIVYHRVQFPYDDWEKFQLRVHVFVRFGFPMLAVGFYLSLVLAAWGQFQAMALGVALVPMVIAGITFAARKFDALEPPQ